MKLVIKRYALLLCFQGFLFCIDFFINVFSLFFRKYNGISLILFIIQSSSLILSLSSLLLTFFSTYAFQAGLADLLYEKFRSNVVIFVLYFILTSLLNIWLLVAQWNVSRLIWSKELLSFYILHRTFTPFYYYYFKRASLRISDPRFYEEVWNEKIEGNNDVNSHK